MYIQHICLRLEIDDEYMHIYVLESSSVIKTRGYRFTTVPIVGCFHTVGDEHYERYKQNNGSQDPQRKSNDSRDRRGKH